MSICDKAATGQISEEPRIGMGRDAVFALSYKALEHLTMITAECLENIISPTPRCVELPKEDNVWGSMLDNLRKIVKSQ